MKGALKLRYACLASKDGEDMCQCVVRLKPLVQYTNVGFQAHVNERSSRASPLCNFAGQFHFCLDR
jgi:hypothetical protein